MEQHVVCPCLSRRPGIRLQHSLAPTSGRTASDRFQDTTRETVKAAQSTSWSVSEASLTLGVGSKVRVRDF
jgi:hypothetical protein